jgi:hypothetical protein
LNPTPRTFSSLLLFLLLTAGAATSDQRRIERINAVNDATVNDITLDQTDEETLVYEVSDEALEAAAGAGAKLRFSFAGGDCTTIPACFTSPAD